MSSGFHITINLAGEVSKKDLIEILDYAHIQGLRFEMTDEVISDVLAAEDTIVADLESFLTPSGHLALYKPNHNHTFAELVEHICQTKAISYQRIIKPDDETGGQTSWWIPGMPEVKTLDSDHDGYATLRVNDLQEAIADGTLEGFIKLRGLINETTIPDLPAFKVSN